MSNPATFAPPELGEIIEFKSLTVVVFPAPFGPKRP